MSRTWGQRQHGQRWRPLGSGGAKGPRGEEEQFAEADRDLDSSNRSKAQCFLPSPSLDPPSPKLSSKTQEGAVSIATTVTHKSKPRPVLRSDLSIS